MDNLQGQKANTTSKDLFLALEIAKVYPAAVGALEALSRLDEPTGYKMLAPVETCLNVLHFLDAARSRTLSEPDILPGFDGDVVVELDNDNYYVGLKFDGSGTYVFEVFTLGQTFVTAGSEKCGTISSVLLDLPKAAP